MNRPNNIVQLRRIYRTIPPRDLNNIFRIPSARETGEAVTTPAASPVNYDPLGDEQPDAIHWPSFFGGIILGLAGGLLAIALPAIVLARVLFGSWF